MGLVSTHRFRTEVVLADKKHRSGQALRRWFRRDPLSQRTDCGQNPNAKVIYLLAVSDMVLSHVKLTLLFRMGNLVESNFWSTTDSLRSQPGTCMKSRAFSVTMSLHTPVLQTRCRRSVRHFDLLLAQFLKFSAWLFVVGDDFSCARNPILSDSRR